MMLVGENAHLSNALILGSHVTAVPKGYLYFAISFSLFIEVLNMKASKRTNTKIGP
jgi:predicted tellurium resistance membrane protein TerC